MIDLNKARAAILSAVLAEVVFTPSGRLLWELATSGSAFTPSVKGAAERVIQAAGWHYSTTNIRSERHGVPTAARIVRGVNLCYAAWIFDRHDIRVAEASYLLGHATPQSFNRFVRRQVGMSTGQFRKTMPFPMAREWMLDSLVRPYAVQWATFDHLTERGARRTGQFIPMAVAA